jgi:hypothetical protein
MISQQKVMFTVTSCSRSQSRNLWKPEPDQIVSTPQTLMCPQTGFWGHSSFMCVVWLVPVCGDIQFIRARCGRCPGIISFTSMVSCMNHANVSSHQWRLYHAFWSRIGINNDNSNALVFRKRALDDVLLWRKERRHCCDNLQIVPVVFKSYRY